MRELAGVYRQVPEGVQKGRVTRDGGGPGRAHRDCPHRPVGDGEVTRPQLTPMSRAIVYIVDDDASMRQALSRLIRTAGLDVETFPSASTFLDRPRPSTDRPVCLVLDVRLPGPSGLDLQSELTRGRRDIPIVFITAHSDVRTSVLAMKGGAVDFLQKPFSSNELLSCIQGALLRSRAQRAERAENTELGRRLDTLTPREREVLMLVVTGKLNKQIAADLSIAEKTIKVHRGRVMHKLQASSVADLIRITQKLRLR
jgi:FixJ family two-component response regulator